MGPFPWLETTSAGTQDAVGLRTPSPSRPSPLEGSEGADRPAVFIMSSFSSWEVDTMVRCSIVRKERE